MGSMGLKIHDDMFFQFVFYSSGESFHRFLSKTQLINTKKPPFMDGLLLTLIISFYIFWMKLDVEEQRE